MATPSRKWESGSSKRKRKAETQASNQKLSDNMLKFLKKSSETTSVSSVVEASTAPAADSSSETSSTACTSIMLSASQKTSSINEVYSTEIHTFTQAEVDTGTSTRHAVDPSSPSSSNESLATICDLDLDEAIVPNQAQEETEKNPDYSDPALWEFPINDHSLRCTIVRTGPVKANIKDDEYPKDNGQRHFSNTLYQRVLKNGESQERRWLVYSASSNKVFCFACRLFTSSNLQLVREGVSDWSHIHKRIQRHENSREHACSMIDWINLEKGIQHCKTIDAAHFRQSLESERHWFNLFERLIDIIQFLASHNLAFRGHKEGRLRELKLKENKENINENDDSCIPNAGNFIDLFKLLAKYDPTLLEHTRKISEEKLKTTYLSPQIQNELIKIMADTVLGVIVEMVKKAKYYAIMLDCTRDAGRVEQMTVIIRFCDVTTGNIEEHFLGFLAVTNTTGEFLTKKILDELERHELDIQNCRGQGYDNGANMVGINSGVKTRILGINPRAFFTPCGCHSWNLLLVDAANSSVVAKTFFGFIQKIYVLFSRSGKRWDLIKDKLKLTLKSLSETRWESRIEAVKAILFQYDEVIDCVESLRSQASDADTLTDCKSIIDELLCLEFVVSLHVWHELLRRVNTISKLWQSKEVDLSIAIDQLQNFCKWLQEFRLTGFETTLQKSLEFVEKSQYDIAKDFKVKRVAKKKKMFGYEGTDEPIQSPIGKFKIEYFNTMLDAVSSSMETRFQAIKEHFENFGFLYNITLLAKMAEIDIKKHCMDLYTVLTVGESSDFQPSELVDELLNLQNNLPSLTGNNPQSLLKFIKDNHMDIIYPNLSIVLRILLTIPVSTAAAERSFSKLKLIKNYLRTTMTQERLSGLAVLSVEARLASKVDYTKVIKTFSEHKSRKVKFC